MALTASTVKGIAVPGDLKYAVVDYTFDNSYPTNGEVVDVAAVGFTRVLFAVTDVKSVGGTVDVANVHFDVANNKLKVYDQTPAEVANTADLSTLVVRVVLFGY